MFQFSLAPFCGAHEQFTWVAAYPTGMGPSDLAAPLKAAGFQAKLEGGNLSIFKDPSGANLMARATGIQVSIPTTVALEKREPLLREVESRINAAMRGEIAPQQAACAHSSLSPALQARVEERIKLIQDYYLADNTSWAVGYSGGKDSTLLLTLVWMAIAGLPQEQRAKTVWVNSTDTQVENPIVARMAEESLALMDASAQAQGLPIQTKRLHPTLKDSFWVTLLGLGYAAPRPLFRWCTTRLKIRPANHFVLGLIAETGRVIQVLGTRKAESAERARTMEKHEAGRLRPFMSPNGSLKLKGGKLVVDDEDELDGTETTSEGEEASFQVPGGESPAMIFSAIEDFTTQEVWECLHAMESPWGYDHSRVTAMYASATDSSECPMQVDKNAKASCGKSRFGCWCCTMVQEEKSLTSFISNDPAYGFLQPLLDFRNSLSPRESAAHEGWSDAQERTLYRVQEGQFYYQHDKGKLVRGRYVQAWREAKLRALLEAQMQVRQTGPEWLRSYEVITLSELEAIREHWLTLWNEIEDSLPRIYEEATGLPYPGPARKPLFRNATAIVTALREACASEAKAQGVDADMLFAEAREVLAVEARRKQVAYQAKASAKRRDEVIRTEKGPSTSDVMLRHRVHTEFEAHRVAKREQARKETIKRVIEQARAAVADSTPCLPLQAYNVHLDLGGLSLVIRDVIAQTPAEAAQVAADGFLVADAARQEPWGLDAAAVHEGARAEWTRRAKPGEEASTFTPETWGYSPEERLEREKQARKAERAAARAAKGAQAPKKAVETHEAPMPLFEGPEPQEAASVAQEEPFEPPLAIITLRLFDEEEEENGEMAFAGILASHEANRSIRPVRRRG
jgi:DNA sulfur modification protein DndC